MKAALTAIIVFCGLAQAGPKLLTFDKTGHLTSETQAAIRAGGIAYVSRDALYGAASGLVEDGRGGMHPVLWITGDDVETGVATVWIGLQAPAGPDESTQKPELAQASSHTAKVLEPKETGAEGVLARLECSNRHELLSEPLYDEHGLFAGWHVSRTVDGKVFSYIVPGGRIRAMPSEHLTLDEWNARHVAARESAYARALGHLWADDIEGALFYLRKAVDAEPTNARAWLQLGFAEGKAGLGQQRIRSYRKAIELDPTLCAARYLLGVNLLMTGNRDEAQVQYKALKDMNSPYAIRLKTFIDSMHVDELGDKKVRHRHTNGSA